MSAAMIGFILGGIFCGVPMMLIAATLALEKAKAEHKWTAKQILKRERMSMEEVTRIFTVEITCISKGEAGKLIPKEEAKRLMEEAIREECGADHVLVTNVQDFIRGVQV